MTAVLSCNACKPTTSTPTRSDAEERRDSGFVTAADADDVVDAANTATTESATDASSVDAASGDLEPSATAPEGMLLVPGGTFVMGTDHGGEGDERPAHRVTIAPFFLDRTEVTQEAYEACVGKGACKPADPAILATFGGLFRGPRKPVVGVSWFGAHDYCAWLGKRLPREAEFERAVRGEDGRRYPWGDEEPTHERTVFATNAIEEVGAHPSGHGPYGHDDLAGNVWEWLADDYDPFAYTRDTADRGIPGSCTQITAAQSELRAKGMQGFTGSNPIPTECEKNIRGGAYNYSAAGLRSTNRIHHPPRFKLRMTGLRCAKDAR